MVRDAIYGNSDGARSRQGLSSSEQLPVIVEALLEANRALTNQQIKLEALELIEGLQGDMSRLRGSQRTQVRLNQKQAALVHKLQQAQDRLLKVLTEATGLSTELQIAVKELQELNMSFNQIMRSFVVFVSRGGKIAWAAHGSFERSVRDAGK